MQCLSSEIWLLELHFSFEKGKPDIENAQSLAIDIEFCLLRNVHLNHNTSYKSDLVKVNLASYGHYILKCIDG